MTHNRRTGDQWPWHKEKTRRRRRNRRTNRETSWASNTGNLHR